MVNLLPPSTKRTLLREYYLRVFATFFLLSAVVMGAGAGLLLPSYYLARAESEEAVRYLDALQGTADLRARTQTGKSVQAFTEQVALLKEYGSRPFTAEMISRIQEHLSGDVSITTISVEYEAGDRGRISLGGSAKTRTALLTFAESLREELIFSGVSVPVGQLAGDSDLPYSLTFQFAKPPLP